MLRPAVQVVCDGDPPSIRSQRSAKREASAIRRVNRILQTNSAVSRFSEAGLIQLGRFVERTQEFSNAFQDTQRLEALMAPYQSDLKVVAAERRVVAAYKTMQYIIQQAGVQPSK